MSGGEPRERIAWLDGARGLAVLGMCVFHAAWDLHFFGLIDVDPSVAPGWRLFGRGIALSFLFIAGASLTLATRTGMRWRPIGRRLAMLGIAALAVTVASRLILPDRTILFGILHCIWIGTVLALPLLRAPAPVVLAAAVIAAVEPSFVTTPAWTWWLGTAGDAPPTLDFEPIFPSIAPMLAGIAAGRLIRPSSRLRDLPALAVLTWPGRRSLLVYLAHQPVLFLLLTALAGWPQGTGAAQITAAFTDACQTRCLSARPDADYCRAACECALETSRSKRVATAESLAAACVSRAR